METATIWQFVWHSDGAGESWTWRRARPDGTVLEVSVDPHPDYGKVVYDAIRHGFQPKTQPWVVTDSLSVTRFAPPAPAPRRKSPSRRTASRRGP